MVKTMMFVLGAATGFAVASGMTDDQRRRVRESVTGSTRGPRTQQIKSAVADVKDSVADATVDVVTEAAEKVAGVANHVSSNVTGH